LVEIFFPQIGHINLILLLLAIEGLVLVCSTPRDEYTGDCLKQEQIPVLLLSHCVIIGSVTGGHSDKLNSYPMTDSHQVAFILQ
jgi:hypothetical protein